MTPDALTALTTASPDYPWERAGTVTLPLLSREVPLQILCDSKTNLPTVGMADAIGDLLALGAERWSDIAALMLADAQDACINVDLGYPTVDGEDTTTTNRREIGLNPDGTAPDGWAKPDWVKHLQLASDPFRGDYAVIAFKVDWEQEHGFHVRLKNDLFEIFTP